jgi:hypothetical protein
MFYIRFSPLTFLLFYFLISLITKGIHCLHNRAKILSMLLIMLLSDVDIHICHY